MEMATGRNMRTPSQNCAGPLWGAGACMGGKLHEAAGFGDESC
jgi:hypothetical protein